MRALVVANPAASATSPHVRSVLTHALASEFKIEVVVTTHRGHARELAAQARVDGLDVVVVLGGDGTVNEVVNGLLEHASGPEDTPALAVVPGGCANVFARALGLPGDAVEATGAILEALARKRTRTVGLGRADGRYFTFCAGLGLDGATVHRVEELRPRASVTPWRYVRAAAREYFTCLDRRHPQLTLTLAGGEPEPVHVALVCNTRPWTYLGDRPMVACPRAGFDTGLDVMALRRVHLLPTLANVARMVSAAGRGPRGRSVVHHHDLAELRVQATRPLPLQVDGDYVGERDEVRLVAVPGALRTVV